MRMVLNPDCHMEAELHSIWYIFFSPLENYYASGSSEEDKLLVISLGLVDRLA